MIGLLPPSINLYDAAIAAMLNVYRIVPRNIRQRPHEPAALQCCLGLPRGVELAPDDGEDDEGCDLEREFRVRLGDAKRRRRGPRYPDRLEREMLALSTQRAPSVFKVARWRELRANRQQEVQLDGN